MCTETIFEVILCDRRQTRRRTNRKQSCLALYAVLRILRVCVTFKHTSYHDAVKPFRQVPRARQVYHVGGQSCLDCANYSRKRRYSRCIVSIHAFRGGANAFSRVTSVNNTTPTRPLSISIGEHHPLHTQRRRGSRMYTSSNKLVTRIGDGLSRTHTHYFGQSSVAWQG